MSVSLDAVDTVVLAQRVNFREETRVKPHSTEGKGGNSPILGQTVATCAEQDDARSAISKSLAESDVDVAILCDILLLFWKSHVCITLSIQRQRDILMERYGLTGSSRGAVRRNTVHSPAPLLEHDHSYESRLRALAEPFPQWPLRVFVMPPVIRRKAARDPQPALHDRVASPYVAGIPLMSPGISNNITHDDAIQHRKHRNSLAVCRRAALEDGHSITVAPSRASISLAKDIGTLSSNGTVHSDDLPPVDSLRERVPKLSSNEIVAPAPAPSRVSAGFWHRARNVLSWHKGNAMPTS